MRATRGRACRPSRSPRSAAGGATRGAGSTTSSSATGSRTSPSPAIRRCSSRPGAAARSCATDQRVVLVAPAPVLAPRASRSTARRYPQPCPTVSIFTASIGAGHDVPAAGPRRRLRERGADADVVDGLDARRPAARALARRRAVAGSSLGTLLFEAALPARHAPGADAPRRPRASSTGSYAAASSASRAPIRPTSSSRRIRCGASCSGACARPARWPAPP